MPIGLNEGNIGRSVCPGFGKSTYGASVAKHQKQFWKLPHCRDWLDHDVSHHKKGFCWFRDVQEKVEDLFDWSLNISWSTYHANRDNAMILNSMNMIKPSANMLHIGQTPVAAFDQQWYATAKQIQLIWPVLYSENTFVIIFGVLHIEMAVFKVLGAWFVISLWMDSCTCTGRCNIIGDRRRHSESITYNRDAIDSQDNSI